MPRKVIKTFSIKVFETSHTASSFNNFSYHRGDEYKILKIPINSILIEDGGSYLVKTGSLILGYINPIDRILNSHCEQIIVKPKKKVKPKVKVKKTKFNKYKFIQR